MERLGDLVDALPEPYLVSTTPLLNAATPDILRRTSASSITFTSRRSWTLVSSCERLFQAPLGIGQPSARERNQRPRQSASERLRNTTGSTATWRRNRRSDLKHNYGVVTRLLLPRTKWYLTSRDFARFIRPAGDVNSTRPVMGLAFQVDEFGER